MLFDNYMLIHGGSVIPNSLANYRPYDNFDNHELKQTKKGYI